MRRLGTLGTKSLVTLAGLWLVASCSGGSDDDFSDAMGGEPNAGRAGGQSRAGTGGKSQAGAGNDAGQAGMAGDGGAAPSTGGRPTVDPDPGGAGGVPTIEPVAGAGGAPVTPEGGAGGEPVTPMGGAGGEPVTPVGGAGGEPGNDAGAGGSGGEPGVDPRMVFDFESDAQGFAADGANVTIGTSTAQTVSGTQSLKVTLPSMADETRRIQVDAAFWPGSVIELNVWVPEGDDDLWVQPFSHINFYEWDSAPAVDSLVRGGWTKWTYTVPKTFPGGMQRLGIQFGAGARPFAGGDVYVDAITVVDGPAGCSGEEVTKPTDSPGRREFDFESDSPEWVVDEGRTDVVLSRSGDHVLGGTSALKAALTAIPAGESRKIVLNGPETFCGDTVTFNVWTPADSDGLNLQAYMLVNDNWAWVGAVPPAIDRGAYTEITLPVPTLEGTTPIGPGGYRILGIQVENGTGAPFTGDIYIDDVSYQ